MQTRIYDWQMYVDAKAHLRLANALGKFVMLLRRCGWMVKLYNCLRSATNVICREGGVTQTWCLVQVLRRKGVTTALGGWGAAPRRCRAARVLRRHDSVPRGICARKMLCCEGATPRRCCAAKRSVTGASQKQDKVLTESITEAPQELNGIMRDTLELDRSATGA